MRILFGIFAAALLAACATQPANDLSGNAVQDKVGGAIVVATLAPFGSYEWQAAPTFTRLIVLRKRATAMVYRHEISAATATQILQLTDLARADLDAGIKADAQKDAGTATLKLISAGRLLDDGQRILEKKL